MTKKTQENALQSIEVLRCKDLYSAIAAPVKEGGK